MSDENQTEVTEDTASEETTSQTEETSQDTTEDTGGETLLSGGGEDKAEKEVATPADWPDDWAVKFAGEDKKALKDLSKYGSPNDVYKALRGLQARVSAGELKATAKPEDDAGLAKWREENGVPESAEGYLKALEETDGLVFNDADKEMMGDVFGVAHGLDLPKEAMTQLTGAFFEARQKQEEAVLAADKEYAETSQDELISEWGNNYRGNVNLAKAFIGTAPEEVQQALFSGRGADGRPLGNNPHVIRWLVSQAKELNPTGTVVASGESKASAIGERIAAIEKVMEETPDKYWKDDGLQAEYQKLLDAESKFKAA